MISVDLKSLINHLNPFCTTALEGSIGLCASRNQYEVNLEHVLLKTLDHPLSDVMIILSHFDIEQADFQKSLLTTLEELRVGNPGKPKYASLLFDWMQEAYLIGSINHGFGLIRSGILLMALLMDRRRFGGGAYMELLDKVSLETLKADFPDILAESIENETAKQGKTVSGDGGGRIAGDGSALARFAIDYTIAAQNGKIDPVFGRDREIRQMIDILARRRKNNPIVVGEAGVGKTAVVEGLALQVVENDVPDVLKDVTIMGLDMGLLQAGASVKGEFENRLKSVIDEVKASPKPIILFIDEAHTLIGAGGATGGNDAANLLKPALARGELRTIAATTWSEYKKYFEKDPALARRFQPVKLDEPSENDAKIILRGLKDKYEQSHGVYVEDQAVDAAVSLSARYIHGRQLPDKAVDLLDTACARVKIGLTTKPACIQDVERRIAMLEREQKALQRDQECRIDTHSDRLTAIESQITALESELEALQVRWDNEKSLTDRLLAARKALQDKDQNSPETNTLMAEHDAALDAIDKLSQNEAEPLIVSQVNEGIVAKVVADWTGIPMGKMLHDEARTILNTEAHLSERIKGQPQAIALLSQVIRASKSGIGNPDTPLGVFLLVGPSGVGKTETAISIADLLFGGERFMVTINMSEFQEKHTVSRLIGSPPGYVGYGEGGVLTEAVRQRPYSVVLLDEVEKADPEVMNLFYQVFDKGMLSDGEGRTISFRNTVVIMTSNLASDIIENLCPPALPMPDMETISNAVKPVLSAHFKPALLARMTVVPYVPISPEAMGYILDLKLNKLAARLKASHNLALSWDDNVKKTIVARCTEVDTGARNIDHILNSTLLPLISVRILESLTGGELSSDMLRIAIDQNGEFDLTF